MSESQYTERQRLWIGHKAQWERMSRSAVLRDWTPPPDTDLCDHGASACSECQFYGRRAP